jgi:hypothetical protein
MIIRWCQYAGVSAIAAYIMIHLGASIAMVKVLEWTSVVSSISF